MELRQRMPNKKISFEHKVIAGLIQPQSSVLDLGCGDGELLAHLVAAKQVKAQGIEISEEPIYQCVAKGLSVFHQDLDSGLQDYTDKSFDYVVLDQSLQQVRRPDLVLREALRVGRKVIVGFPNFTYFKSRFQLFFLGKTPVTSSLPFEWYETPNLHFLSISDFFAYCRKLKIKIEKTVFLSRGKKVHFWPNLLAHTGIFVIKKK